jgi:transposase
MSPGEYQKCLEAQKVRTKKTDELEVEVLAMIQKHPDYASAQIFDRLKEKYLILDFCESTLRGAIRRLREEHEIPRVKYVRSYEAVDELPMGQQLQVDYGMMRVENGEGKTFKIYVIAFVLSHSRHKYCQWQTRPFTTLDTVMAHEDAFEFYGGIPKEIVYDQDHLILVSENHGDLIFTSEFSKYRIKRQFEVYMCRKADPESKGKIENVVKYVKYNFAKHRIFSNLDKWNEDCLKWLARRGNGKMHETTRKIPSQVFEEEKKHLKPFGDKLIRDVDKGMSYQVRKNNTVPIEGNRYSVPRDTYKGPYTYVNVETTEEEIIIMDTKTGLELNRCNLFDTKGNLFKNNNHKRDNSVKLDKLMDETLLHFSDCQRAKRFLEKIRIEKPRYARDQFVVIKNCIAGKMSEVVHQTLVYCETNKLYSASDFKDVFKHFDDACKISVPVKPLIESFSINDDIAIKLNIKPAIRNLDVYKTILNRQEH